MSEYKYTDPDGDTVTFSRAINGGVVVVASDSATSGVARIEPDDVSSVAAELLKAAGQESVIVPKSSLAVTTHHPDSTTDTWITHEACGPLSEAGYSVTDSSNSWLMARHWISIALKAEQLEAEAKAAEAAAKSQLAERRNRIAAELAMGEQAGDSYIPGAYASARTSMKRAVDRIIELEDGQVAA